MAQVKNEEEKKKETTKRVTKKTTTPEKISDNSKNKATSKSSKRATTKKQSTTKKNTTTQKAKIAKDSKKVAKNESEDTRKVKDENPKKEVKKRNSKKETTNEKDTKKKTTTKTKKSVTQKTKTSKNTKSAKGKITKIIGSRNQEKIEDDVVITDAKETDVVKINDEEKLQIVENEVKKDLKSKNKLPKTEERKLSSVVFENLCVAIAVMIYLFFIILGFINIKEEVYVVDLKVFSFIILVIAILLFERAYKKDSVKLCAFGIEILFLSITTMGLLYANIEINNIFLPVAATVSLLFAIYYVTKSIYLYTKMKKRYFVDNMKDIIKKEEKE